MAEFFSKEEFVSLNITQRLQHFNVQDLKRKDSLADVVDVKDGKKKKKKKSIGKVKTLIKGPNFYLLD